MHLKRPTWSNKQAGSRSYRILLLVIALAMVSSTSAAQDTSQTQEQTATKLMAEGLQLITEGSPASLQKAIDKFESARVIMHSLHNALGEAALLSITGSAYFLLGQSQKAIEKYEQSLPFLLG